MRGGVLFVFPRGPRAALVFLQETIDKSRAHFELKSGALETKRRTLAHSKPKTAVIIHAACQGQQENQAGVV